MLLVNAVWKFLRLGNSTLDFGGVNFWSICGFVESPRDFSFLGGGLIFAPIRSSPSIGIQTSPPPPPFPGILVI